jgi:hypothetical protein
MSHAVERAVRHELLNRLAVAHAQVTLMRHIQHCHKDGCRSRQWVILLKRVVIGGIKIDHLWIQG